MQQLLSPALHPDGPLDLSAERPLVGVSGGVNSAALLVYLGAVMAPDCRPPAVTLFHADLEEHPPDVPRFVAACVRFARGVWGPRAVAFGRSKGSALAYFEAEGLIPHPTVSPCTGALKLEPMEAWLATLPERERPTVDLVGFVREERRRALRQQARGTARPTRYPICHLTDAECFELVDRHLGWHPAVYDLRREDGGRAFTHANCLPCKNMHADQLAEVERHFPERMAAARATAERLTERLGRPVYWGRASEYAGDPCAACAFG